MREGSDPSDGVLSVATPDCRLTERLYAQCASFYDRLCGPVLQAGRREAMRELKLRPGNEVLEVGIGTALTAPLYPEDCKVTGIDISERMLREAERQIVSRRNIQLLKMDAMNLRFADESFDVVYAAYVISVVPDPLVALREMRRVCRVGGRIVLLNHFLSESPFLAKLERLVSPFVTARLGFRTDLDARLLLAQAGLQPLSASKVNKPRIWTLIHCQRQH
jgi:phosphatidylethanolamine/phosphatidyl-N-methylethanolamine N-methyltransferase